MSLILIAEEVDWVLDTHMPLLHGSYIAEQEEEYDWWVKVNHKPRVDILTCMSDILTTQFEHLKMGKEVLKLVKEMFGSALDINKQKVLDLLNTKMPEGGSAVDHVLKLMEYIQ